MKILIANKLTEEFPKKLKNLGEVTQDLNELPDCEVVIVRSKTKVDKTFIDKAKNMKLIIRAGVGVDNIDTEYCKERGVIVKNTPQAPPIPVAELVFAHILSIKRRIVDAHNTTKQGKWEKKSLAGTELYGKTLGILGLGRIGIEVAKRAKAFGMSVIYYSRTRKPEEENRLGIEYVSFDDLLSNSDIITVHVSLTKQTQGLVNKEFIDKMKPSAILINTSRGKVVNEKDLFDALQSGKLSYVGLDVFSEEPPKNSPLLKLDNILLTPHLGAQTVENMKRNEDLVVKLIEEYSNKTLK